MKTSQTAKIFVALFLLVISLATEQALAENFAVRLQSLTAREVRKVMRQAQMNCPKLDCEDSRMRVHPMSGSELHALGTKTRAQLRKMSRELAMDLWPDTILEGPFHSVFRIRLDRIERLSLDNQPLGYRLSFSDKAWNTDHCAPSSAPSSESHSASLKYRGCETGRISDAGFLLDNMKTIFRDESVVPTYRIDAASADRANRGLFSQMNELEFAVPVITIPGNGLRCDKKSVESKLISQISRFEEYLEEERGLFVCDDNEQAYNCYEESSLVTLLGSLIPETTPVSFTTDAGYAICDQNEDCNIQFRISCGADQIQIQEL